MLESQLANGGLPDRITAVMEATVGTILQLAIALRVSDAAVRKWVGGKGEPSASTLIRFNEIGINPLYLLGISAWRWANNEAGNAWAERNGDTVPLGFMEGESVMGAMLATELRQIEADVAAAAERLESARALVHRINPAYVMESRKAPSRKRSKK